MIQAGSMGVPYVPIVGLVGTDLLKRREDMKIVADPFDGKTKSVVAKALRPDVAIFHVQKADRSGNISAGYPSDNVLLAEASRTVIVTAEEIVDRVNEKDAVGSYVPGIHVDVVVHAPHGAHPAGCPGVYGPDRAHMALYVAASKDDPSFAAYLKQVVFDVPNHEAYVERFVPKAASAPMQGAAD
jgi:glutaconate CoA-transferase, subunit A